MSIKLPSRPMEDVLAWHYDRTGLFSVKSAYRLAQALEEEEKGGRQSSSAISEGRPCWKAFWKIPIPHKILIFGWKAINNGLATQSNKRRRRIVMSSSARCVVWRQSQRCMLLSGAHMQRHSDKGCDMNGICRTRNSSISSRRRSY